MLLENSNANGDVHRHCIIRKLSCLAFRAQKLNSMSHTVFGKGYASHTIILEKDGYSSKTLWTNT